MRLEVVRAPLDDFFPGVFAMAVSSRIRPPSGEAGLLDWRLGGALSYLVLSGLLDGRAGERMLFWSRRRSSKIYIFGAGAASRPSGRTVADCAENMVKVLLSMGESEVVLLAEHLLGLEEDAERALAFLTGVISGGKENPELFAGLRFSIPGEAGSKFYYESLRKAVLRKGTEAEAVELAFSEAAQTSQVK